MNVVYFLHPLEKYAKEMKRILKRGKGIHLLPSPCPGLTLTLTLTLVLT